MRKNTFNIKRKLEAELHRSWTILQEASLELQCYWVFRWKKKRWCSIPRISFLVFVYMWSFPGKITSGKSCECGIGMQAPHSVYGLINCELRQDGIGYMTELLYKLIQNFLYSAELFFTIKWMDNMRTFLTFVYCLFLSLWLIAKESVVFDIKLDCIHSLLHFFFFLKEQLCPLLDITF